MCDWFTTIELAFRLVLEFFALVMFGLLLAALVWLAKELWVMIKEEK